MPAQARNIVLTAVVAALSLVAWKRRPVRHPDPGGSWSPVLGRPAE